MKNFDINAIQLQIQSPDIKVREDVNDYILEQVEKLGKTFGRIKRCEFVLKVDNDSKNKNCNAEVKLFVPGDVLFAAEKSDNFRLALKMVFDNLYSQLYRFKEKITDKTGAI